MPRAKRARMSFDEKIDRAKYLREMLKTKSISLDEWAKRMGEINWDSTTLLAIMFADLKAQGYK